MRIAVLGTLRVSLDGREVPVTGFRRRALLVRLALESGGVVGFRTLIEQLWPEGEPANPGPALHSLVARLRRLLPPGVLCSEPAGYRLALAADALDLTSFERLAGEGRRLLRSGQPGEAFVVSGRALALWRGEPLGEFTKLPFAATAATRLREVRLATVEDRIEAELASAGVPGGKDCGGDGSAGGGSGLVAELEQLIAEYPLRERLRLLSIRALDADGRRSEALAAYENYRALVAEELGADPGPELRRMHLNLLRVQPVRPPGPDHAEPATTNDQPTGAPTGAPAGEAPTGAPAGEAPEHGPLGHRRGNLRAPLTSFVGREADREQVAARLRASRLVTLVGPGGVGKTRLATEAAATLAGTADPIGTAGTTGTTDTAGEAEAEPEVWQVDLATVTEPDEVPRAVASALGIRPNADLVERLSEALSVGPTLLLLDGCEHLANPVARLAEDLLGRCPELSVLVTSREPLGITGEALQPVAPLDPDSAARLFTERAEAASPGVRIGDELERICRRLDGLPLAIELAAARLRSMPVEVLAKRLEDRFRLLSGGSRTALPRHRTLRSVVAWSWDLLEPDERDAAEQASVFVSGFTAEAAGYLGIAEDTLYALVDKSLLVIESGRFRMLDTIAEYGVERLGERAALLSARTAHADCYLALAEAAEPWLRGADQLPWLARLIEDRENLLAALRFALDSQDADTAVRMAAGLSMFWTLRGAHVEATGWIGRALRLSGNAPAEARARATAGYLLNAMFAGEFPGVAPPHLPEPEPAADEPAIDGPATDGPATDGPATAFVRAMAGLASNDPGAGIRVLEPWLAEPDAWQRGMLWFARSLLHTAADDAEQAHQDMIRVVSAFREAGERWGLALALMSLASVHTTAYDGPADGPADRTASEAIAMLDEASALTRELGTHDEQLVWLMGLRVDAGDREGARAELRQVLAAPMSRRQQAMARLTLADLARYDGDLAETRRQLGLAGEWEDPPFRALYACSVGFLAVAEGELDAAEHRFVEAGSLAIAMPDRPMLAIVAVGLADVRLRRGDRPGAADLLGIAAAIRGGQNLGNPDVARLRRELADQADRYAAASALEPATAIASIRTAVA